MNELQNKESLKKTLEEIRQEKYPDLPADLVSKILDIQSQDRENTSKTHKQIRDLIIEHLSQNQQ